MKTLNYVILALFFISINAFAVDVQIQTFGTCAVDGNTSEWSGTYAITALYKAARTNKEVLGTMYAAYECNDETHILYLYYSPNYPVIIQNGSEVWVKSNNSIVVSASNDGSSGLPTFAWINSDGTYADGWEAAIAIAPGTFSDFDFHSNVWEGGESQTCGINGVELVLDCGGGALDVEFSGIDAQIESRQVTIQWNAVEAVNHAGYNIWRQAEFNEFEKVNTNIIVPSFPGSMVENTYEFVDELSESGEYTYKIQAISTTGESSYSEPVTVAFNVSTVKSENTPAQFRLYQNYPNPFNPQTTINFEVAENGLVELTIFDTSGRTINTLWNRITPSGSYSVIWNGLDNNENSVASGMYFYQLKTKNLLSTKRMTLIK